MSSDVGKAAEGLENELWRRWSAYDVGEATEGLENELWRKYNDVRVGEWGSLTSLYLRHSSFSNPSAALPTSQFNLQPFRCFTYVIGTSPTSPGEPPMPPWWCLIYPWWFCNLQWLRPAGLHERWKLALELKRLKTPWFRVFLKIRIFELIFFRLCLTKKNFENSKS